MLSGITTIALYYEDGESAEARVETEHLTNGPIHRTNTFRYIARSETLQTQTFAYHRDTETRERHLYDKPHVAHEISFHRQYSSISFYCI